MSPQKDDAREDCRRKSVSPNPDRKRRKNSSEKSVDKNLPSNVAETDKSPISTHTSKGKKSKHKDKHNCISPVPKKRTKKKKEKRDTKEGSNIGEENACEHERSTKKKKSKKKKTNSSNKHSSSSDAHISENENNKEKSKVKKKKKKSDRALEILDLEIRQLLSKDYDTIERELLVEGITNASTPISSKIKISRKDEKSNEEYVKKSYKKESKHKKSTSKISDISKLKEEQRRREQKRQRKKFKKCY